MGFAGSTALLFEDALPVQPVILQASRYQGIRVNLMRAVVATAFPRLRACLKLPLTKKLMSFSWTQLDGAQDSYELYKL